MFKKLKRADNNPAVLFNLDGELAKRTFTAPAAE